jgi:hypothetical protein
VTFLGLDIGTTSTIGILIDWIIRELAQGATHGEFDRQALYPRLGHEAAA